MYAIILVLGVLICGVRIKALAVDRCLVDGLYPDASNCSRFYMCAAYGPVLFHCPAGLHFNPTLNYCDWPEDAGCLSPATTTTQGLTPSNEATTNPPQHTPSTTDIDMSVSLSATATSRNNYYPEKSTETHVLTDLNNSTTENTPEDVSPVTHNDLTTEAYDTTIIMSENVNTTIAENINEASTVPSVITKLPTTGSFVPSPDSSSTMTGLELQNGQTIVVTDSNTLGSQTTADVTISGLTENTKEILTTELSENGNRTFDSTTTIPVQNTSVAEILASELQTESSSTYTSQLPISDLALTDNQNTKMVDTNTVTAETTANTNSPTMAQHSQVILSTATLATDFPNEISSTYSDALYTDISDSILHDNLTFETSDTTKIVPETTTNFIIPVTVPENSRGTEEALMLETPSNNHSTPSFESTLINNNTDLNLSSSDQTFLTDNTSVISKFTTDDSTSVGTISDNLVTTAKTASKELANEAIPTLDSNLLTTISDSGLSANKTTNTSQITTVPQTTTYFNGSVISSSENTNTASKAETLTTEWLYESNYTVSETTLDSDKSFVTVSENTKVASATATLITNLPNEVNYTFNYHSFTALPNTEDNNISGPTDTTIVSETTAVVTDSDVTVPKKNKEKLEAQSLTSESPNDSKSSSISVSHSFSTLPDLITYTVQPNEKNETTVVSESTTDNNTSDISKNTMVTSTAETNKGGPTDLDSLTILPSSNLHLNGTTKLPDENSYAYNDSRLFSTVSDLGSLINQTTAIVSGTVKASETSTDSNSFTDSIRIQTSSLFDVTTSQAEINYVPEFVTDNYSLAASTPRSAHKPSPEQALTTELAADTTGSSGLHSSSTNLDLTLPANQTDKIDITTVTTDTSAVYNSSAAIILENTKTSPTNSPNKNVVTHVPESSTLFTTVSDLELSKYHTKEIIDTTAGFSESTAFVSNSDVTVSANAKGTSVAENVTTELPNQSSFIYDSHTITRTPDTTPLNVLTVTISETTNGASSSNMLPTGFSNSHSFTTSSTLQNSNTTKIDDISSITPEATTDVDRSSSTILKNYNRTTIRNMFTTELPTEINSLAVSHLNVTTSETQISEINGSNELPQETSVETPDPLKITTATEKIGTSTNFIEDKTNVYISTVALSENVNVTVTTINSESTLNSETTSTSNNLQEITEEDSIRDETVTEYHTAPVTSYKIQSSQGNREYSTATATSNVSDKTPSIVSIIIEGTATSQSTIISDVDKAVGSENSSTIVSTTTIEGPTTVHNDATSVNLADGSDPTSTPLTSESDSATPSISEQSSPKPLQSSTTEFLDTANVTFTGIPALDSNNVKTTSIFTTDSEKHTKLPNSEADNANSIELSTPTNILITTKLPNTAKISSIQSPMTTELPLTKVSRTTQAGIFKEFTTTTNEVTNSPTKMPTTIQDSIRTTNHITDLPEISKRPDLSVTTDEVTGVPNSSNTIRANTESTKINNDEITNIKLSTESPFKTTKLVTTYAPIVSRITKLNVITSTEPSTTTKTLSNTDISKGTKIVTTQIPTMKHTTSFITKLATTELPKTTKIVTTVMSDITEASSLEDNINTGTEIHDGTKEDDRNENNSDDKDSDDGSDNGSDDDDDGDDVDNNDDNDNDDDHDEEHHHHRQDHNSNQKSSEEKRNRPNRHNNHSRENKYNKSGSEEKDNNERHNRHHNRKSKERYSKEEDNNHQNNNRNDNNNDRNNNRNRHDSDQPKNEKSERHNENRHKNRSEEKDNKLNHNNHKKIKNNSMESEPKGKENIREHRNHDGRNKYSEEDDQSKNKHRQHNNKNSRENESYENKNSKSDNNEQKDSTREVHRNRNNRQNRNKPLSGSKADSLEDKDDNNNDKEDSNKEKKLIQGLSI